MLVIKIVSDLRKVEVGKIKIEVRLFAYFREGRDKVQVLNVDDSTSILDILKIIQIREEEVALLLLNGFDGPSNRKLKDGDVLSLFPPVGGG